MYIETELHTEISRWPTLSSSDDDDDDSDIISTNETIFLSKWSRKHHIGKKALAELLPYLICLNLL